MSEHNQTSGTDMPPSVAMLQMIAGFWAPRALLEAAGFKLTQIILTQSPMSIIESVRA